MYHINHCLSAIGKKKPEKNQGFNGIRTRDLCDTGAMLYQLSYEATHLERGQFIEFISSCVVKLSALRCYCSVIYGWLFLISRRFFYLFYF